MQTLPHGHHDVLVARLLLRDWEDHFYLCDGCMHDLIEFMKRVKE